ncbi:MAG: putative Rossmann fold flavoprotein [Pseudohongiellaceae bacterium]|jgi:predicted Rossmann fold flavoprotein
MINNKQYDVVVVGGGASGLFCASQAASRGRSVLVLDSSNKVGKKILMSGGGRCNFTNYNVTHENYLSKNPHFFKSALNQYNQWQFIAMVERYDISYHERKHGELFCDDSAKDILAMLLNECAIYGVEIVTRCELGKINRSENSYTIDSNQGGVTCESLVMATGGLSIPTMGASGFAYDIAQQFGLSVLPRIAGLVPFTFSDYVKGISEKLTGLALEVEITVAKQSFTENLLFTHRGLSGPSVLQISNYWTLGDTVAVNLLPDHDLFKLLPDFKQNKAKSLLRTVLSEFLSKGLVAELEQLFWLPYRDAPLAEIPDAQLNDVAHHIHQWQIKPSGTEGYRTAEVTLGGVDTQHLSSKTMECKDVPGLYFIGEAIDVTGHLGGFNFQWAWSSAFVAAQHV